MRLAENDIAKERSKVKEGKPVVASIRDLHKSFGDRDVLKGVNLDLYESENLVILGRSGTGKSVLIKCMVGLIKPDSGSINILERDVFKLSPKELNQLRLEIGFSFQGSALYDSMTIRENLEFPLKRNLGIYDKNKLKAMASEALEDVGLLHTIDQMPAELSGGMKKRVGIPGH
jgi:phospholipid/cholesterol/gamma-HCH transport system ATP-binding protein